MSAHDKLQSQAFQWAHNTFPQIRGYLWAVFNELEYRPDPTKTKAENDKARMIAAQRKKALGRINGILDLHLDMPNTELKHYPACPYEFDAKLDGDKLSPEQLERIERLKSCGGDGFEFRTLAEFQAIFTKIMVAHFGQFLFVEPFQKPVVDRIINKLYL